MGNCVRRAEVRVSTGTVQYGGTGIICQYCKRHTGYTIYNRPKNNLCPRCNKMII